MNKTFSFSAIASLVLLTALLSVQAALAQKNPNPNGRLVLPSLKIDITNSRGGILIGGGADGTGGQFVPWGGSVKLSCRDALPGGGANARYAFNVTYTESNLGSSPTGSYTNRIYSDGDVRAINTMRQLNGGETKTVTTQPYLDCKGTHQLTLNLDDGNAIGEYDETNNKFFINYYLSCDECDQAPRIDITSPKGGLYIGGAADGTGGQFVPWGGSVKLSCKNALPGGGANNRYAFNVTYVETNMGADPTGNYTNKLYSDADVRAINTMRQLNGGETKTATTQPYLDCDGMHKLTLKLDDGNAVAESNEGNNEFYINYYLSCGECR